MKAIGIEHKKRDIEGKQRDNPAQFVIEALIKAHKLKYHTEWDHDNSSDWKSSRQIFLTYPEDKNYTIDKLKEAVYNEFGPDIHDVYVWDSAHRVKFNFNDPEDVEKLRNNSQRHFKSDGITLTLNKIANSQQISPLDLIAFNEDDAFRAAVRSPSDTFVKTNKLGKAIIPRITIGQSHIIMSFKRLEDYTQLIPPGALTQTKKKAGATRSDVKDQVNKQGTKMANVVVQNLQADLEKVRVEFDQKLACRDQVIFALVDHASGTRNVTLMREERAQLRARMNKQNSRQRNSKNYTTAPKPFPVETS